MNLVYIKFCCYAYNQTTSRKIRRVTISIQNNFCLKQIYCLRKRTWADSHEKLYEIGGNEEDLSTNTLFIETRYCVLTENISGFEFDFGWTKAELTKTFPLYLKCYF